MAGKKELKYTEDDITFFKNDVEKIQQKPSMYIGDTAKAGYLKVILEPLDNSVDEFRAGRNTFVHLDVDTKTGILTVKDNGVGIPVGIHKKAKISTLTHIFTALQSSGKINSSAYKNSAGTHGIGVTATNAMSEFLECWTYRKDSGGWHYTKFENGLEKVKVAKVKGSPDKSKSGTIIRFKHNNKYFNTSKISKSALKEWFEITSYLNAGLELKLTIDGKSETWKSKQGLIDYVEKQLQEQEQTNICKNIFSFSSDQEKDGSIEFALAFTNLDGINIQCHTNSVLNVDKGVHYDTFRTAFHKLLKNYAPKSKFTADDALDGVLGMLNFNINDAQFNNQAKNKLVDIRVKDIATPLIENAVNEFLTKNRKFAMDWAKRAGELRKKTEQFLDAKGLVKNIKNAKVKLSAKLAGVSGKCKPEDCELYLVEGDSAGGSSKAARDKDFQAVMPLKGKPLNVLEAKIESIQKNEEIATLLAAIGIDPTKLGTEQVTKNMPYGKIIYLADADVDGSHINTLLSGVIYKFCYEMFEKGMVYIVKAPEYLARFKDKTYFAATRKEMIEKLSKAGSTAPEKIDVTHLKGWGEIDAEDLKQVAMNPASRELIKIKACKNSKGKTEFEGVMKAGILRKKLFGVS